MTDIIFSFDTEDYTSNAAADAILEEARILREEGIKGCFNTVGLLARALKKWGRQDIIEELRYHELSLHSYGHTLHPTIHEYTDIADFDKAYELLTAQETEAARLIKEVLGHDKLYAACPPGWNMNYVAMYAYADMGIPIHTGFCCDTKRGDGAYYCNLYQMQQDFGLERILFDCTDEQLQALLDERFAKKKRSDLHTPR